MKLTEYLGVSAEALQDYINQGLVDTAFHPTFPLCIFTYSRKCVGEQAWDHVTTKCRGLIANTETEEIVARPFEKFFNYGDPNSGLMPEEEPDTIYEKMDGFLCTLYEWAGKSYIASKGSFDSPHAKWATAVYNNVEEKHQAVWPKGYTPVFEGITKNLRIVVDYGDREELVLIGLVKIETGEELSHASLQTWGSLNGFNIPSTHGLLLETAARAVLDPTVKNVEGFVAYWSRPGETPYRLKIKYQDYLRIHRLVTGVSPKRVLEALSNGWTSELDEWTNESTPWFNHFIKKWRGVLESKFGDYCDASALAFAKIQKEVMAPRQEGKFDYFPTRKTWALAIQEYPDLKPILFAMLDGKETKPIIWKMVKPLISGSRPMIDAAKM